MTTPGIGGEQRILTMRFHTSAGLLTGTMRVPKIHFLAEALDHAHEFIPLTDVTWAGQSTPAPFLAIRRDEIIAAEPPVEEKQLTLSHGEEVDHEVGFLLHGGTTIAGKVKVMTSQRVSDALRRLGFVVVHDARILGAGAERRVHAALVNPRHAIGVLERC